MSCGAPVALRETCRIVAGSVPLWAYHRARLRRAGVAEDALAEVERVALSAAAEVPEAQASQRYRLSIGVCVDARDVTVMVSRELSSLDVPNGPTIARVDVAELPELPTGAAKPMDRSYWDAAMRSVKRVGAHQPVLVDDAGWIVDGGTASVWAVLDGVLVTPPAPPAVAGVARAFLLDTAPSAGLLVRVEPLSWERFDSAEEQLLTNAFGGVAPVRGRGGAVATVVADLFAEMWRSAG